MIFIASDHPTDGGLLKISEVVLRRKLHIDFGEAYLKALGEGQKKKKFLAAQRRLALQTLKQGTAFAQMAHKELKKALGKKQKLEVLETWIKRFKQGLHPKHFPYEQVRAFLPPDFPVDRWHERHVDWGAGHPIDHQGQQVVTVTEWMKSYVRVVKWHENAKERCEWAQNHQKKAAEYRSFVGLEGLAEALEEGAVRYLHEHVLTPPVEIPIGALRPTFLVGDLGFSFAPLTPSPALRYLTLFRGDQQLMVCQIDVDQLSMAQTLQRLKFVPTYMPNSPFGREFFNAHPTEKDMQSIWIEVAYDAKKEMLVIYRLFQGGLKKRSKKEVWRPEEVEEEINFLNTPFLAQSEKT